ncbi:MAG: hypothetical protein C5B49_09400 [Bdellovibrio sp.]|nr:MAG: hypothetical protein C5B49_09400 [Bdellovibrio sp.]
MLYGNEQGENRDVAFWCFTAKDDPDFSNGKWSNIFAKGFGNRVTVSGLDFRMATAQEPILGRLHADPQSIKVRSAAENSLKRLVVASTFE